MDHKLIKTGVNPREDTHNQIRLDISCLLFNNYSAFIIRKIISKVKIKK